MNDHHKPPQPWDLPVIRGLDAIRLLPGMERLHVGFDELHLQGDAASGRMYTAVIHAYQPVTSVPFTVRFAVQGATYTMRGRDRQPLTASGVADLLHVPPASAELAITILKRALTASLRIYNQAHNPTDPDVGQGTPAAKQVAPWPFRAPPVADAPTGPTL
jgi:hypothetical protein